MESYELYLKPATINPVNGRFRKGNKPFNKGMKQTEWMDGRKIKRVKKYLELGRIKGNEALAGFNRIQIVGIKEGKLTAYRSAADAARILKAKGIKVSRRNITRSIYNPKWKCGGFNWFFVGDTEKYKNLIT